MADKFNFNVKIQIGNALGLYFVLMLLCLVLLGETSALASNNPATDEEVNIVSPVPPQPFNRGTIGANLINDRAGEANSDTQNDTLEEHSNAADDVMTEESSAISADEQKNPPAPEDQGEISSHENMPPIPPPEKIVLAANETTLPATSPPPVQSSPEEKKLPSGPKTSEDSSIGKPLLISAGIALAVGAAVAAGGGSGSDAGSDSVTSPTSVTPSTPGQPSTGDLTVINLSNLVRIGDDVDYNANHPDHFQVSNPSGLAWSDSFNIENDTVSSAQFKYTVAASKIGNPVYVNGRFVDGLCNPGNLATIKRACSMDITDFIHSGSNEIKIKCALDPSDTVTPYDDVELYNLRIELKH